MNHIVNHIRHDELVSDSTLHVIGVVSNPVRWHSRYRLAREWIAEMERTPNVRAYVVEAAHGDRHHEVTSSDEPRHLQVRTNSEIWVKESMINLGRRLLPHDARYLAWTDMDVSFRSPGWALETIHQLQHHAVVQPWQHCTDLGPQGEILQTHTSFGYVHQQRVPKQRRHEEPYVYAHTGFAWACTRAFFEGVGGLLDFCILGSADHHMAWAMIGDGAATVPGGTVAPSYARRIAEWQRRALRSTHGEVGFTPGRIEHAFHGAKKRRYYRERWQILRDHHFDPDADLEHDDQGLVRLVGKPALEQALRLYNRSRGEDGVDP